MLHQLPQRQILHFHCGKLPQQSTDRIYFLFCIYREFTRLYTKPVDVPWVYGKTENWIPSKYKIAKDIQMPPGIYYYYYYYYYYYSYRCSRNRNVSSRGRLHAPPVLCHCEAATTAVATALRRLLDFWNRAGHDRGWCVTAFIYCSQCVNDLIAHIWIPIDIVQ